MCNTYHVTSCPCIYRHMLSKTTIPNHPRFCFYCHLDYVPQQNRGRKKIEWGEAIHIVNLCIVSYLNLISFQFLALYIYILILKSIKHLYPNLNKISRIRSKFKENGLRWSREFFFFPSPSFSSYSSIKTNYMEICNFPLFFFPFQVAKYYRLDRSKVSKDHVITSLPPIF